MTLNFFKYYSITRRFFRTLGSWTRLFEGIFCRSIKNTSTISLVQIFKEKLKY